MQMKSIAYISKVENNTRGTRVPTSLFEIYQRSRKNNAKIGITGILAFSQGYYLQVIEGEDSAVDQLFNKIRLDRRHGDVTKIIETPINHRYFPNWSMRLIGSANREKSFNKYINDLTEEVNRLQADQLKLLNVFYKIDVAQQAASTTAPAVSYAGKSLKLLSWPDFTQVTQTPAIIGLCAQMAAEPQNYNDLVSSGDFGSRNELDTILQKFEYLGILVVSDAPAMERREVKNEASESFYRKMRSFLKVS